jgi:metallo-beta-lactamase class B
MSKTWARLALALLGLGAATSASPAHPATWTQEIKPFRIAPHIYYVGSRGLSAYLITSDAGGILIDGPLEENASLVEHNIESVGVPLKSVKWILSDHAHNDHVGALAQIKRDTGARFAASAGDQVALERGVPRGDTDYDLADFHFPPIKVDRVIQEGQSVAVGDAVLTAHLTPGHTPGCTSWSTTVGDGNRRLRVLFLCSITVAGNILVGNGAYPAIAADYEATFAKLSAMKADIVLTSHPEMADILGREARLEAGDGRAFIDPTFLPRFLARSRADFKAAMSKATHTHPRPRGRFVQDTRYVEAYPEF